MDIAKMLCEKEGILFTDLASLVTDAGVVSKDLKADKWKILPYRTAKTKGTALSAIEEMQPQAVTLDIGLSGWYAIYLGMESIGTRVDVRFTGDRSYRRAETTSTFWHWMRYVEEDFFRIVKLEDGKITFSKTENKNATIYWIRAVPLAEGDVTQYLADRADKKYRRLNVTEDFCETLARYDQGDGEEPWLYIVEQYKDADVESMSLESFGNRLPEMPYVPESISRAVQRGLKSGLGAGIQKRLIEYGHELGWKMYLSQRMSYGKFESPMQSANAFFSAFGGREEFCCTDRDGRRFAFLSYAYPQVRQERIRELTECVASGCDGVELIFNRCPSLILFEKPFAEKFEAKYGFAPNTLPLSDQRIIQTKAEIMTSFFEDLQKSLAEECERLGRKRVSVGVKVPYSVYDCLLLGIDLDALAQKKLVDRVVTYPVVMREDLSGDIWADAEKTQIDLEKYTRYADENEVRIVYRRDYSGPGEPMFAEPIPDQNGIPRGPSSLAERIEEFLRLEKYGVEVGVDVLPRTMPAQEVLDRFRELNRLGVKHFSLWDTYARVVRLSEWCLTSRMGHGDEIEEFSNGQDVLYRSERLLELDGIDISRYLPNWIG